MVKKLLSIMILTLVAVCSICAFTACSLPQCQNDNHVYGEWQTEQEATCLVKGKRVRECEYCHKIDEEEIDTIPHDYTEWEVVEEATCVATGLRYRICLLGGERDEEIIPIDENAHVFTPGIWEIKVNPTCTTEGLRSHVCNVCNNSFDEIMPIDENAHVLELVESESVKATCSQTGTNHYKCKNCDYTEDKDVELDIYNHSAYNAKTGYCDDCHGLLDGAVEIKNEGKGLDYYELYLEGDFEIEYYLQNFAGVEAAWDNFIFDLGMGEYVNGRLQRVGASHMLIPFHPGDTNAHYGKYWTATNCSYEVNSWFLGPNGEDPGFAVEMQKGVTAKVTLTNVNGFITMVVEMTCVDGYTFQGTFNVNFPGAKVIYVGLTGEDNREILNQVYLKSGAFATAAEKESQKLITESKTITNTGKNVEGVNYAFEGDFDMYFDFEMSGAANRSDWHSFIFYLFSGNGANYAVPGQNLLWSGTANGAEPENSALYHGLDHLGFWRSDVGGYDFGKCLENAKIYLHVVRNNGYVTVNGVATTNGNVFARYGFTSISKLEGTVTFRITTENSTATFTDIRLVSGELAHNATREVITVKSTCVEEGKKDIYCIVCGALVEKDVPVELDPHNHVGAETYVETVAPSCAEGKEEGTCACGETVSRPIPANGQHIMIDNPSANHDATCVAEGRTNSKKCQNCNEETYDTIPVDMYAHVDYDEGKGYCSACKGFLKEEMTISNEGVKYVNVYDLYVSSTFELVYKFDNLHFDNNPDGNWHNFIFNIGMADYYNGTLAQVGASHMLIPFHPGDTNAHYGEYWQKSGCSYNVDRWFLGPNGEDPGFAVEMMKGTSVVATIKGVDGMVYVNFVITCNADGYEFRSNAVLNFGGARYIHIGFSGENNQNLVKQITLNSGSVATNDVIGTELLTEEVTVTNADGTKNVEGVNYAFEGDFSMDYEFVMNGNAGSDWHSFIFYIFQGNGTDYTVPSSNLLWSGTANGAEPENSALFHDLNWKNYWRIDTANVTNFAEQLATAKVYLHVTRKNGYITVTGRAVSNDENETPFTYYGFASMSKLEGVVTVRITSENSAIKFTSIKLLSGEISE